ncbi:MAG: sulfatase-like hydrolase/transferase, partial [bacterium]
AGGAAIASGCATLQKHIQSKRPNVLLIVDDQHSPRAVGCAGQSQAITPNLDRLAAEGVRFTNGYCSSPVCAPTRHTLYTGLYISEHGVLHNDLPMRDVPTMISMLNQAGYTTANIGKMHNAPYHHRRDFQYVLHHEFFDCAAGISHFAPFLKHHLNRRGIQPKDWSKPRPGKQTWLEHVDTIAFTADWLPEDLTAEHWITDESLRFIRSQLADRPDQPFFLHASYFPPHHPYAPIPKYAALYQPEAMELPPNYSREKLAEWCKSKSTPDGITDEEVKRMRACYFGFCAQVDAEIGRLLKGLDQLGVAENTMVIFVSDHGDMLGEHGRFYKGVMYEASARVPFIVRWPGVSDPREESVPVMHADLVPTILCAAGVNVPASLPGRDLRPLLGGAGNWSDRAIYSEYFSASASHLMIRRGPFKLIASAPYGRWTDFQYNLFNVVDDPWECVDLAEDPTQGRLLRELQAELMTIWNRQREFLPKEIPPVTPRSTYKIPYPADPWQPVFPA